MQTLRNHFWSLVFSLFFIGLVAFGVWYLIASNSFARSVGVGDVVLMSLAVWRLTRLFTYDAITKFVRDWNEHASPTSFAGTFHTLMTCPWCTGLWFGATVVLFYFATPLAWPVVLILAIAAVGSFLQIVSNYVGWSAEYKKVQAQQLQGQTNISRGGTCG